MSLSVSVRSLPDNDQFLPRYLTVHLLTILAKTIPYVAEESANSESDFLNNFHHKDQFTPLTYSIFWGDNFDKVLEENSDDLDALDKYNRTALTLAIANENFPLAEKLVSLGATVFLEDKLVLEITLMSMLQRDDSLGATILSGTEEKDQYWVGQYLDYLHGYAIGKPGDTPLDERDVLNPPIRHFGQVLDTLVYFNGIPSHYGFLSPSLKMLCDHLNMFEDDQFAPIGKAFAESCNICKFHGNLPSNANAAQTLSQTIQANYQNNKYDPVLIFGGWAGSAIALAFVGKSLLLSNLGVGGDPEHGTQIYNIKKIDAVTPQFVDQFIRGLGSATSPKVILELIGDIVDAKPVYSLKQSLNPIDNCIFVNPRAIIEGILLVTSAYQKDGNATKDNLEPFSGRVADEYKIYLSSLFQYSTADLTNFMRNNELLQNKRLECCSLALEYINQHYQDPDALQRCIDLKNALEYVGLREYYESNISLEARSAIQEQMILQQEIIAVDVIEKEYEALGKKQ